ncbi:Outer membrane porin protein BP0840 precursor [Pandoraea pulmonicola]|uniref:Outer membrane porin protein BP0840 n=2 Tax=Pandoraea pulmonicola TaxID=93221 RepID=A0AAJ4ZC64_PANPU|nr:Outer membrane porin protein BP0840 precursor [Pandoraea pulmonicola]
MRGKALDTMTQRSHLNNGLRALALAATLTLLAVPASVQAQSNVTLYGTIDSGFVHANHVATNSGPDSLSAITSNIISGSRWGLRGTESLGNGLSALFQIESGFNAVNGHLGNGGLAFGRKAIIGLRGNEWGEVTIGRQYDPVVNLVQGLTADGYFGGFFATPGDVDNYDNGARINNAIRYATPNFGGLQFEGMYASGNVAGKMGAGRSYGLAAAYSNGPVALAAGYFFADGGNTRVTTSAPDFDSREWSGSAGSLFNSPINNGFRTASHVRIARAGAKYAIGPAILGVSFSNAQYASDALSLFTGTAKFDTVNAFATYALTPAINTGIGYSYTRMRAAGDVGAHYNQFNAGITYALSKRTSTYVVGGYQQAAGKTLRTDGSVANATASVGSYGIDAGANTQLLVGMGLKHSF